MIRYRHKVREDHAVAKSDAPGPLLRRATKRMTRDALGARDAALVIVTVWLLFIVIAALVEHLIDPKTFGSVWEGMWWGAQTVTTVGYGDVVPHDTVGKVIGVILMIGGLSLITVITAVITSVFVSRAHAERTRAKDDPVMHHLKQLSTQVEQLKAEVAKSRPRT